ncbi:hypothetical protein V6N11_019232 [Hibiscus sabdariffa]|uniref:Uncharacterized protein n=2 Tax=Hibiscus sabdariffa TaxID=183260 RepID=A0ABR2R1R1_9ROSI
MAKISNFQSSNIFHFQSNNKHEYKEALDVVHVSKEDQESVFTMLAAVLWLGNVSFTMIDNENHVEAVEDESKEFW